MALFPSKNTSESSQGTDSRFSTIPCGTIKVNALIGEVACIIVDNTTGVQYLNLTMSSGGTCITPLYNADGTLMIKK